MDDKRSQARRQELQALKPAGPISAALYARVSSERQVADLTIASQVDALRERMAADGLAVEESMCFLDEGYSGQTLLRPALERLRDAAHSGVIERLYVHSPDRLARKYALQAVLLEELGRQGVEVLFLNHDRDDSPEGEMLLQMQGMFAEYERAKILERSRRGRRFAARQGKISALGRAPYGYRYIPRDETGEARYQIVLDEARIVRQMFEWVGLQGLSLRQTAQRLTTQGVPTATGKSRWDQSTVAGMLKNPAYRGSAAFGKTRRVPRSPQLRPRRGQPEVPRHATIARPAAADHVETIPVPAIVSAELFDAVGGQLEENRRRRRERQPGGKYLLSGLLVCRRCGSAYCARRNVRCRAETAVQYRCIGTDKSRFAGEAICQNASLNGTLAEEQVWADVCVLLRDPDRVRREFERRLERAGPEKVTAASLRQTVAGLKRQIARLLDAWENDWIERSDFESRIARARERLRCTEQSLSAHQRSTAEDKTLRLVIADFAHFAEEMSHRLDNADFETKRKLLTLLIKRIEVDDEEIRLVYKVTPPPFEHSPAERGEMLHHCWRQQAVGLGFRAASPL